MIVRVLTELIGMVCTDGNAVEAVKTWCLMYKKLRLLQLSRDFDCAMTSTWASCDGPGEFNFILGELGAAET